jgi:hypothetical protein
LEGKGNQWSKKKGFYAKHWDMIPKATWTSLNLERIFTCLAFSLRTCYQKINEGSTAKGDTKDLNAIKGAIQFNKGDKPKR